MKDILISQDHAKFVEEQAPRLDIGGFSNLASKDLGKATRLDYQYTGLYGELAWYMYRYNDVDRLKNLLDFKFETCRKKNIGDAGHDDRVVHNDKARNLDIKTTYVSEEKKISSLNLVVPPRELHERMIYVCAFAIGESRRNINKVVLTGWCFNEDIHKKWKYDTNKFCVPVADLRKLEDLDKYIK